MIGKPASTTCDPSAPIRPDKPSTAWLPGLLKKLRTGAVSALGIPPDPSDCSALGTWASTFWAAPAGEATAWVTAAAWVPVPAGLVVGGGGLNGVTVVAAAQAPAYPYIAAASWAHISAYWASMAAIAGVFCPT